MTDLWSERAESYRQSQGHASGDDLDTVVEWCEPSAEMKILDVATGGGHVARRLRERGAIVVTLDPSPGMQADVVASAEDLPFDDASFDVVVTRIAPHHFTDIRSAIAEFARVANRFVVIEDTLYSSEEHEQAEKLRDPTHVRSYSEEEWREMLSEVGLEVELVDFFAKTHPFEEWLARTECAGDDAQRVRELLRDRTTGDGTAWTDTKIALRARRSQK